MIKPFATASLPPTKGGPGARLAVTSNLHTGPAARIVARNLSASSAISAVLVHSMSRKQITLRPSYCDFNSHPVCRPRVIHTSGLNESDRCIRVSSSPTQRLPSGRTDIACSLKHDSVITTLPVSSLHPASLSLCDPNRTSRPVRPYPGSSERSRHGSC